MLITFKSKAAADLLMYKTHAKPLLDSLGKDLDQGIITAEDMAAAIAALENEITLSKRQSAADHDHNDSKDSYDEIESGKQVSISARAFPLLEMMRAAQKEKTFVMWGV
jgi:Domain of unknown function (DUF1840)